MGASVRGHRRARLRTNEERADCRRHRDHRPDARRFIQHHDIAPRDPDFHIAIGRAPDYALGTVHADLLVAGHTHGGQVQLPGIGPLLTLSRVPHKWAPGRTELPSKRTLIVSRGIGMERSYAPRLRFLCRRSSS